MFRSGRLFGVCACSFTVGVAQTALCRLELLTQLMHPLFQLPPTALAGRDTLGRALRGVLAPCGFSLEAPCFGRTLPITPFRRDVRRSRSLRLSRRPRRRGPLAARYQRQLLGVVGVADPYRGEEPVAFVVLKPDAKGSVDEGQIIEWCRANMSVYKAPRQIRFVDSLPRTASGKMLKRVLRDQASAPKGN